jgi:hypothetical protein
MSKIKCKKCHKVIRVTNYLGYCLACAFPTAGNYNKDNDNYGIHSGDIK